MRLYFLSLLSILVSSCEEDYKRPAKISTVTIEHLVIDSTLSVRALDFDDEYVFYGSSDHFGKIALQDQFKINLDDFNWGNEKNRYKNLITHEGKPLHFRAIEAVDGVLFALSISNPARLYKLPRKALEPELVYEEIHDNVFYDALAFWNKDEGIAIGDPTDECMSIIITRDGGNSWDKLSCNELPKAKEGEAAFAASDTNIAIKGDQTWIATGGLVSRVLFSPDKGKTWTAIETPIINGKPTTGMYSIDFYDDENGFAIGGDYTKPNETIANKIRTIDGGKTWQIVANEKGPGYRSCVQYIPNSGGNELVAIGFKGIDYSNDAGASWTHLSDEGLYTLRFVNDSMSFSAGKGRLSKLMFR
ncbi:MAG: oxidoreductase [Winogradskyella sp.]|nr:oxidoreductase [Winogradskyella sp.]